MPKIIIASGPVIVENGKVLLNQHGDDMFWKFCGGKAEDFELDLIETAKKEVMEEMGIEIEIINPKPFIQHVVKQSDTGDKDIILVHYLASRIGEIKEGADIKKWGWFKLNDLPPDLGPNILPALKYFGFIKE
jgi:8-oxo-dGTP pyrophosphatase MutT (NUDIX family)